MSTVSPKATPAQSGVGYEPAELPTFESGAIVPMADACTMKEVANVERTTDNEADVDNIGTAGHHVVISGDFKITAGTSVPNVGDEITSTETTPRKFTITTDVEISGFSAGGLPMILKFDAEFHPKVDAAV